MAQTIQIKRSVGTAAPSALAKGELAYSDSSDKLFIGAPADSAVTAIGGKLYVDMLDHTAGTLTASSAIVVDANSKIDQLLTTNLTIGANSITAGSGNIQLTPHSGGVLDIDGQISVATQATEIAIIDNSATALTITEGSSNYLTFDTQNTAEKVIVNKPLNIGTAYSLPTSAGTSGQFLKSGGDGAAASFAAISNSDLANASVTIGNTEVTLGGSSTTLAGLESVVIDDLTIDGSSITAAATDTSITLVPHGAGTVDVSSKRITSVATPTASTDAANKAYVDAVKQALDIKDSVRVATTGNITIASGLNVGDTVDGVTLADGDRVLVKSQTDASQNGIYVAGASPARSDDASATGEITPGMFVFVEEGTANGDNGYVVTTNGTITIGTTDIAFAQFSGAGQITAGDGLSKSGNTLNVNDDNITLEIDSDNLRIKGITATAKGDLLIGAAGNAGYTRLVDPSLGTGVTASLKIDENGLVSWSSTIEGGSF
jgi:hypothetical protein